MKFQLTTKYKMMSCGIRKSMSQLTFNTMCLLKNEDNFLNGNHSLNETWLSTRPCKDTPEFRTPSLEFLTDPETVRFAFIRDPIERFVSLYLDKCLNEKNCWSCDSDMRCVVREIYSGLKKIQNHREWKSIPTYMDLHAAPLSWNCGFNNDLTKWNLLIMGADAEERKSSILQLGNLMKRQGVPEELLDKVQKDTMEGETIHSTHKSTNRLEAERQVREDPVVRDYLHKIYFFDYLVFPFNRERLDAKYQTDFWKLP
uniref:Carbohydrate sulfotransferase n=1 Tax=Caenorhabditis tropicalis TaxID=1561998 RepID=A0A1I7T4V0_9PELO